MSLIQTQDGQLEVEQIGMGQPNTVCAPCDKGGGGTALAGVNFPYLLLLLRGQGQSLINPPQIPSMTLQSYFDDFDATLAYLGLPSANFIAYSQAAYFVARYAMARPGAVSKLVLIEPALFTDTADLMHRAQQAMVGDADGAVQSMINYVDPNLDPNAAAQVRKGVLSMAQSPQFIARSFQIRAANPTQDADIGGLTCPILLIGGSDSHLAFMVNRASAANPNAQVFWVQGASHLNILDNQFAGQVSPVLNGFINGGLNKPMFGGGKVRP